MSVLSALASAWKAAAISILLISSVSPASAQEKFSSEKLTVQTADGKSHEFTAELATNDGQRQQGLMFRKSMEPDHGMLFDFGTDRDVSMWMRNTFIPLDMVFIAKDGQVTHVHRNAVPHSEDIISSRGAVRYVLELNGGVTRKLGIESGATVRSKQIGNIQ